MTTDWQPTHINVRDGELAREVSSDFGRITLENKDGNVFSENSLNWREIQLVPTLSPGIWRVTELRADNLGLVTVKMEAHANVKGIRVVQAMEFMTIDPPQLGDEFIVTVTPQ